MSVMRIFRCIVAAIFALAGSSVAFAATSSTSKLSSSADAAHVHVQLVMPQSILNRGESADIGLYFKLEPGWHVYWKNAGDSGEPPRIRWTLPDGITAGEIQFPAPKRLPLGPLMDFGYEDEVLFPMTLTVANTVKPGPAVLDAKVSWLVCREVCIPEKAELALTESIPVQPIRPTASGADEDLYKRLLSRLPEPTPANAKVVFQPTADGFRLAWQGGQREASAQFFPAEQNILNNPAPQAATPLANGVVLDLKKDPNLSAAPAQLKGILELADGHAYEIAAVPGTIPAAAPGANASGLVKAAGLAFLGGIILNLMPCVFPVLFLKGLSLVNSHRQERAHQRTHGLVYTAGIVVSFWLLVGALLALRAAGATLGWGFQFQSPIFVALMAGLLFFLGLSLAGQFEIGLTLTSAGGSLAQKQGYAGSFFTGVLAVVVATPCTAPFMGAAVGYALAQSAVVTFAIFTALALGLAAPYLLLTLQPAWTRLLPKPGAWMEILKQATAVPIFGFVIWLTWVLASTRGAFAVLVLLSLFLLLAIAGWILGRWPAKRVPSFAVGVVIVTAIGICIYGLQKFTAPVSTEENSTASATNSGAQWEPWSQAAVDKYRAAGRPVFVDFTASWCLSCQVNERVALRTPQVEAAFKKANVALLKADWTERDDAIAQALAGFGRSGVPAYALYTSNSSDGPTLLPEALTPGIVVDALNKLPAATAASTATP
ncbi:protein-disulfide reductase DsbD family protein [Acidicapsa dinghuensis]|uniref:Protein-disulfide reductase DsbD family protein n=1 Tax=Acidicapsa dinghuensis TaxID=2218256 RepID=A0ABW1EKM7_9BACT|nr:protein-disulfide reductase DsbD domain-containing protein [Acidicapsa dinghuensis]